MKAADSSGGGGSQTRPGTRFGKATRSQLPPGPRLPRLVQIAVFMTARARLLPRWRRRWGDVFTLNIAPGGPAVVLADPNDIREAFRGSATEFHAGEGNAVLAPVLGEHSLFLLDDEQHGAVRRKLVSALRAPSPTSWRETVEPIAVESIRSWPQATPFAIHPRLEDISIAVILRLVFGISDDYLRTLHPQLRSLVRIGPVLIAGWVIPALDLFGPWRRYARLKAAIDEQILGEIARRRAAPDLAQRTDVLSKLLTSEPDMSDRELRDHLITLLLAGHETTAATLAWTVHDLTRHPDVYARAREAAEADDDAYLNAVVQESMRLRPAISSVARRLTKPATIAGWDLPADVTIFACIQLAHRHPDSYPNPEQYDPERFVRRGPQPGAWIPFGGGIRRCPGAPLASVEVVTVLKTVLLEVDLSPVGKPEGERSRNVTTVPSRGARVISRRR